MIQYPGRKRPYQKPKNKVSFAGRGMSLEEDINRSNEYYLLNDMAVVHKKPTPIQVVKVTSPSRSQAKITEAYFAKPSTTDYNGVYCSRPLDFEAKETKNKKLFPLSLFQRHQVEHLDRVSKHGALAFVILRFTSLEKTYLLLAKDLLTYIDSNKTQSLSMTWLKNHAHEISGSYPNPCDYLSTLKELIKEEKL